jgi:hypothetical protein
MTRNILHCNRRFLEDAPPVPCAILASLRPRGRNRNRSCTPEIVCHWVQIANSIVFLMLAFTLSSVVQADESWDRDWTVATIARDGSWGVGIDRHMAAANAAAIRECRAMSIGGSDCGAELAAIGDGWIVGLRCGDHRILVTGRNLKDAELTLLNREIDLKQIYVPDLPACRRVLTIDPRGAVTTASPRISGRH